MSVACFVQCAHSRRSFTSPTHSFHLLFRTNIKGNSKRMNGGEGKWGVKRTVACAHFTHLPTVRSLRSLSPNNNKREKPEPCVGGRMWGKIWVNKGRRTQGKVSERPWTNRNTWEPRVEYQPRSFSLCSHVGSFYSTSTPTVGFTSSYLN